MYQLLPLMLALALFMPWTGPADPGNRMEAANAADGLAEQVLTYHQAALTYVAANPTVNGQIIPRVPPRWTAPSVSACAKGGTVATYVAVPATLSPPAVAAAIGRLWAGYPLVGQAVSNRMTNPVTGVAIAMPCAIPDQAPVVVSLIGG